MEDNSFFGKWSKIIKDIPMNSRTPIWDKAIKFLMSEDDIDGTVANELSQLQIQDIIFNKTDCSIYDMFIDLANWIKHKDTIPNYLSMYFFDGRGVWLAYLMAVHYAMYWDGREWLSIPNNQSH